MLELLRMAKCLFVCRVLSQVAPQTAVHTCSASDRIVLGLRLKVIIRETLGMLHSQGDVAYASQPVSCQTSPTPAQWAPYALVLLWLHASNFPCLPCHFYCYKQNAQKI